MSAQMLSAAKNLTGESRDDELLMQEC